MLKRNLLRKNAEREARKKLALVVEKDYERILIGEEESIIARLLKGERDVAVDCDVTRPFGTLLLSAFYDEDRLWNQAIMDLEEARKILGGSLLKQVAADPVELEKNAQKILQEQYDTGDPLCQYAAIRIWNSYWAIRGKKEDTSLWDTWAQNLVRPFLGKSRIVVSSKRIDSSNPIFLKTKELFDCDRESRIQTIGEERPVECLFISDSLIPIQHFYAARIEKWKKYIVLCKVCKKSFIADSLKYELCSDACRAAMQKKRQSVRKENSMTAEVDKLLTNTNAHWNNRRRKIEESPDYSEDMVLRYKNAMKHFQAERRKKRQAHKNGEITFKQLQDWACFQQEEAERVLQALIEEESKKS